MARRFVFADEAGDFEFARKPNVSRYFIACAISLDSCELGHALLRLRRDLLWDGVPIEGDYFHATKDSQFVRDKVFAVLNAFDFEVYAQILEKSKAQQQIRESRHRFYKHAWYYLFRHTMPRIIRGLEDQLMVTTASIGVKKGQADFSEAVKDVLEQTQKIDAGSWRAAFCSSASDPCLQAADYCTWAIQRKWERNDLRSYDLIRHKIKYEYDLPLGSGHEALLLSKGGCGPVSVSYPEEAPRGSYYRPGPHLHTSKNATADTLVNWALTQGERSSPRRCPVPPTAATSGLGQCSCEVG